MKVFVWEQYFQLHAMVGNNEDDFEYIAKFDEHNKGKTAKFLKACCTISFKTILQQVNL